MSISSASKEKHQDYKGFVEKFKHKKTTDDCYTPPEIYKIIKKYVFEHYKLDEETEIIRPFYPGGDYETHIYPKGSVVIDNPPFSIITKIVRFYVENDIKFFIFAPHLTLFSVLAVEGASAVVVGASIKYENGAKIPTSFVTNLDTEFIRTDSKLKEYIESNTSKRKLPRYEYPKNVLTVSNLNKCIKIGKDISFKREDVSFTQGLDDQKEKGKKIFGDGFLISNKKSNELEEILKNYSDIDYKWKLSNKEKEIIEKLG